MLTGLAWVGAALIAFVGFVVVAALVVGAAAEDEQERCRQERRDVEAAAAVRSSMETTDGERVA